MKMTLNPLQARILIEVARAGRLEHARLVGAMLAGTRPQPPGEDEVRLQIDLLALYGLIQFDAGVAGRVCVAPAAVVRWTQAHRAPITVEARPTIVWPVVMSMALATSGCQTLLPGSRGDTRPATPYNAEGAAAPERIEQFYQPRTGNMVYRFCVGAECPAPTPKRVAAPRRPTVSEIGPDGRPMAPETTVPAQSAPAKAQAPSSSPSTTDRSPVAAQAKPTPAQAVAAPPAPASPPAASAAPANRTVIQTVAPAVQTPTATPTPMSGTDKPQPPDVLAPLQKQRVPPKPLAMAPPGLEGGAARLGSEPARAQQGTAAGEPERFVHGWARLWSAKHADAYFALYATAFRPSYGQRRTRAGWEALRRQIMTREGDVQVSVEGVRVVERDGRTVVSFCQQYQSPSFRSRVPKALELEQVGGEWKIARESLLLAVGQRVAEQKPETV